MILKSENHSNHKTFVDECFICQSKANDGINWELVEKAYEQGKRDVLNQMEPERCDHDTMSYFEDYYWLPESVWQSL